MDKHRRVPILLTIAVSFLLLTTQAGFAQTQISGPLSGRFTLEGSPYQAFLDDSCYVGGADTLVIEAGVVVQFQGVDEVGPKRLWVNGTLIIEGTEGSPVQMSSLLGMPGQWYGIVFSGFSSSGSEINHLRIEYGVNNIHVTNQASPEINNVETLSAQENCIRVSGGYPEFYDFTVTQAATNTSAIMCDGGQPIFSGGVINGTNQSTNALYLVNSTYGQNNGIFEEITINNGAGNGILAENCSGAKIRYNTISEVGLRGINFQDCSAFEVSHNLVINPTGSGIRVEHGTHTGMTRGIHHNTIIDVGQPINDFVSGIYISGNNTFVDIHSNIVVNSTYYGIFSSLTQTSVSFNCYWGNDEGEFNNFIISGTGELTEDNPNLVDGSYTLMEGSPCIDAGHPNFFYNDPDGTAGDMGYQFFNQNLPPEITSYIPETLVLGGYSHGDIVEFSVTAEDPNGDMFGYEWYYRGILRSETNSANITLVNTEANDSVYVILNDYLYDGITTLTWLVGAVSVNDGYSNVIPEKFDILSVYPNPFNATANIRLAINQTGELNLRVFNLLGREVYSFNGEIAPGIQQISVGNNNWASGMYLVEASLNSNTVVRKFQLIK